MALAVFFLEIGNQSSQEGKGFSIVYLICYCKVLQDGARKDGFVGFCRIAQSFQKPDTDGNISGLMAVHDDLH